MTDVVRIWQDYAAGKDWEFSYGRRSNLNLLETDELEAEKVYLLVEPPTRRFTPNANRTRLEHITFSGNMFLMVKSEQDMPYFNEMDNPDSESKYAKNIEPLLDLAMKLGNFVASCQDDLEVLTWDCIDAINLFDENRDGVLITYQIKAKL